MLRDCYAQMSISEWALRSSCLRKSIPVAGLCTPLVYGASTFLRGGKGLVPDKRSSRPTGDEWYYLQAELTGELLEDMDFSAEAFSLLFSALGSRRNMFAAASHPSSMQKQVENGSAGIRLAQKPRLWLSPRGAVSPMHYDQSVSHLIHVFGEKRMVFYAPQDVDDLSMFPHGHMLARRSEVNVHEPNVDGFSGLRGREVVLRGGDVILFGPLWSHYTESLTCCASVTCRVAQDREYPLVSGML
jgi:hypothetical protein